MYNNNYNGSCSSSNLYSYSNALDNNYNYDENFINDGEDRCLLAPIIVGGLAGTALGFGIANNNQINRYPMPCYHYPMPISYYYPPQYTNYSNTNFYY